MRRIMIDASKCDGCKNCTIACMQAHRETPGTVYDLDLTDIRNELPVRRPQSRYCHPYQSRKVRLLPAGRCRTQLRKSLSKTGNLC